MDIITTIAFFCMLLSIIAIIVGLVSPSTVLPVIKAKNRENVFFIYIPVFMASCVFFYNVAPDYSEVDSANSHASQTTSTPKETDEELIFSSSSSRTKTSTPAPISKGKWDLSYSVSPMDDSRTVVLKLDAENVIQGWPDNTELPYMIIRCKENKTELYIRTGMSAMPEYGLYNENTVRIRVDDNKPYKERWSESTDNEALFAPNAIGLAKKLNKAERMLFEFTPYNSNSQLAEFDVRGLNYYLSEIADTCNWKI